MTDPEEERRRASTEGIQIHAERDVAINAGRDFIGQQNNVINLHFSVLMGIIVAIAVIIAVWHRSGEPSAAVGAEPPAVSTSIPTDGRVPAAPRAAPEISASQPAVIEVNIDRRAGPAPWPASARGIPREHVRRGSVFTDTTQLMILTGAGPPEALEGFVFAGRPASAPSTWVPLATDEAVDRVLGLDLTTYGLGRAASLLRDSTKLKDLALARYSAAVQTARNQGIAGERRRDTCTALERAQRLVDEARQFGLTSDRLAAEATALATMRRQSGCRT